MSNAGRGSDQVALRLPDGMRDQLKADAEANGRSLNSEIVARLTEDRRSLRDWFAGHALGGFISRCATDDDWRRLPAVVYEMADAMLSARSNRGEEDNG